MAYNRDALVTSTQEGGRNSNEGGRGKQGRMQANTHLKVAKVFPTVRKEEDRVEVEEVIKVKVNKKQPFPWLLKFNALCIEAVGSFSYKRLDDLMDIYIRQVGQDVQNCYKKPNRAAKLRIKMNDYMKLFHMLYADIRRPIVHNYYLDRMSDLLAMYVDMEIKASRRGKENPKTISGRIMSALFVLLENSMGHILNVIMKAKFFIKTFHEICIPIISRVVRDVPVELNDVSYVQYILVFKKWKALVGEKEEQLRINRLADALLIPPPGFADIYHSSDKFSGLLPMVARGTQDRFTLALMLAPELAIKDNEGYNGCTDTTDLTIKLLEDLELNSSVLNEEFNFYSEDDAKTEKQNKACFKEIWRGISYLGPSAGDDVLDGLFEEEFLTSLKRRQAAEKKQRLEVTAKKISKVKKENNVSKALKVGVGCVHQDTVRRFGYTAPSTVVKRELNVKPEVAADSDSQVFVREVQKAEADSQSQDDVIVVSDDEEDVSPATTVKPEEQETNKRDSVATPVLRAVVRPENIEQLSLIENLKDESEGNTESVQLSESCFLQLQQEVQTYLENSQKKGTEEEEGSVAVSTSENVTVEAAALSAVEAEQPSPPLEEPKTGDELLLEEISKVTEAQEGVPQLWNDIDGQNFQNQSFSDLFDPNDPNCGFICYPDGTDNSQNWSFSHDFILGQCDDDLFSQYESGNTNAFPDFYNDQQDMVFTGVDIQSPPLLEMMRDEPGEYTLTTHWEDLSMMVSDATYQDKSVGVENTTVSEHDTTPEDDGPTVVFLDRRKGKRGKAKPKAKPKDPSPSLKETELAKEKKIKDKAAEDVSKKGKQAAKRKRVRFVADEEEEEDEDEEVEEEQEPEPEPVPKKKRGRQRKTPAPAPTPAPPSPQPPPQPKGRKPRGGSQPSSGVSKKKAQARRR